MPFAIYPWEEPGFAEAARNRPEVTPERAAKIPPGYVREGHGTVLRGPREYEAAAACLDAWYGARGRDGLSSQEKDTLYGMLMDGEECLFRPLVWYMAHWRAQHPEG